MNLGALLPPGGDELCVHSSGRDHSRTALRERAEDIACALADAGVEAGAPVGVMLPNGADLVATLFGVWRAGGVYVPLNPRLTDTELINVIGAVDPAAFVTTPQHEDRFGDRPVVVLDERVATRPGPRVATRPGPRVATRPGPRVATRPGPPRTTRHDERVALVSFTSGTTGQPKPVLLEHAGVLELLDGVIAKLRSRPGDAAPMPNLVPVSLSLWAGIYQVLFAFRVGAPVVVMDGFDTLEFHELVQRFGIRSTVLPPAAMVMLADDERIAELAPLKYVRSISSPLSPLQARRFRDRFGIAVLNGYGQTEIGGEVIGWSAADSKAFGDAKLGSVGRPHQDVEARVDDDGELWVRTPALAGGYADGSAMFDRLCADGWFRTGDVARIDDDGFVWIEGRVSDMVNRGGLKVHPGEVEEVLRLSTGVADAAVVAVPDDRLGEVPWAFCVPTGATLPAADELEALCRRHLAPYKVPVRFEAVDELPRNEVGKVLKRELAERAG